MCRQLLNKKLSFPDAFTFSIFTEKVIPPIKRKGRSTRHWKYFSLTNSLRFEERKKRDSIQVLLVNLQKKKIYVIIIK